MQGSGQAQPWEAIPQLPAGWQACAVMWQMQELSTFFISVFMASWCLLFDAAKVTACYAPGITS
jgi:hypothetical protein